MKQGTTIADRFVLDRRIHFKKGAEIWSCNSPHGFAAIKLFNDPDEKSALRNPKLVAKLERLSSKNLLQPLEVGTTDQYFFYLMPLRRQSLHDLLRQRSHQQGGVPTAALFAGTEAIQLTNRLFDGLMVLHAGGLVHLDVKPSNVLINEAAGQRYYELTDFDNVRDVEQTVTLEALRENHGITPYYAAPEQSDPSYYAKRASDVYAASVTLFEAFTGDTLPDADDRTVGAYQHRAALVAARLAIMGVDKELIGIIQRGLSYSPTERPTAREIYGLTKYYLDTGNWPASDSPIRVTTEGPITESSTGSGAGRKLVAPALLVLLLGLGAGAYYLLPAETPAVQAYTDTCGDDDYQLHQRNWAPGIDRMRASRPDGDYYALRAQGVSSLFACDADQISNLTPTGYAVVRRADQVGLLDQQGQLVLPPGRLNLEEIQQTLNNPIRLQTLLVSQ